MSAIDFVIRTRTGAIERGSVGGEGQGFLIDAGTGNDISLNIGQADLRGYDRAANDLLITLADGRVIVLEGYFDGAGTDQANRVFVSANGVLNEVGFVEAEGGALFAQYGPSETWGKWSPSDDLIFVDETPVVAEAYAGEDEEVSMLAAGLLGAGGLGAAGLGTAAAAAGGAALLGLGALDGNGGGSGNGNAGNGAVWTPPTVDDPDGSHVVGGPGDPAITVTGTATPGSEVTVVIGEETVTGTAGDDRIWEVVFEEETFPADGSHDDISVTVTDPNGTVTELDGPSYDIDTTAPLISVSEGFVSTGDLFNGPDHADGIDLSGTGEPGATLTITIGETSQTVTVGDDGSWSFTFDETVFPAGEYAVDVILSSSDALGNTTTITESVQVDTVNTLTLSDTPLTGDDLISQAEHDSGVTLSGTSQAGATVVVTIEGVSQTAGADGGWTVSFDGTLPRGTYDTSAEVVSTDPAGNVITLTHDFAVDTDVGVTIDLANVEGDGVINAVEAADGTILTGTAEAGASVVVTANGHSYTTTASTGGTWSVTMPAGDLPSGTTTMTVTATATDAAGNTSTASGSVSIDTETGVTVDTASVEGDGVINAAERADGTVLTGTAEAGASVVVTANGTQYTASVAADGTWSVTLPAGDIPEGETSLDVTATATDAAGNRASASGSIAVDTVTHVGVLTAGVETDGVVNAAERADGVTLTGTAEPGSSVQVTRCGDTVQATVGAGGDWTASFTAAQLPTGEHSLTLTALTTDKAGNTATLTQAVRIDTDAGILTIDPDPVETDDVVNLVEASDGVVLTGTSNPGQLVSVTMNGVTHRVVTDASGSWTAPFAASEIAPGTYNAQISATITDSAGNTLTRTDSVNVDTEVLNFAASGEPVAGDNVINASERANGFVLRGTTEPGGTVFVTVEGTTHEAGVALDGSWTVSFARGDLPLGEYPTGATITTTDRAGNTAETGVSFAVDTEVNTLALSDTPIAGDGVVNAVEAQAGLVLSGAVEAGSSVTVTIGGATHAATVSGGTWTVDIPPASVPTGTGSADIVIHATDAAGNMRSITESVAIDTDSPDALAWTGYGRDGAGVDLIRTEISADEVFLGKLADPSGSPVVTAVGIDSSTDISAIGETYLGLSEHVPDGTHLVLAVTDAAGNTTGSYLVTDDPATNRVAMSDDIAQALSRFQVDTIDLHFAEDSQLTITEAQITALSSTTDTVTVRGGADDSVTITGAQAQGTQTVDGTGFNVFSLGDATLLIEDDITAVNGVV